MDINLLDIEFDLLLAHAKLNSQSAADYLGVSIKTIQRWKKNGAPKIAIRALEFRAGIADGWHRFKFNKVTVTTPLGHELSSHQIEQYRYLMQMKYEEGLYEGRNQQIKSISSKVVILDEWRKWNATVQSGSRKNRTTRPRKGSHRSNQ